MRYCKHELPCFFDSSTAFPYNVQSFFRNVHAACFRRPAVSEKTANSLYILGVPKLNLHEHELENIPSPLFAIIRQAQDDNQTVMVSLSNHPSLWLREEGLKK